MKLKPINLISKSALKSKLLKRIKAFNRQNRQLTRFIVFGLIGISLFTLIPILGVSSYKRNVASTNLAMEDTKIKFKKLQFRNFQLEKLKSDLAKEETLLKQRSDLLFSTSSKGKRYSELLALFSELLPQDLWISRFIMNEGEIQISGSTFNSQLIAELMNKLDASKGFKNSSFISSEKQIIDSHTLYNFQISTEPGWRSETTEQSAKRRETAKSIRGD